MQVVPVVWQTPPQLVGVAPAQPQVPVPSHVPPIGFAQGPDVLGVALQTNIVPEQT